MGLFNSGVSNEQAKILKLAEQGNADAQNDLGSMYYKGYGVAQDNAQASVWYHKSAEQGNDTAQYNLGAMFFNIYLKECGTTRVEAHAQAMVWFHKAAEQDNADAQAALAEIYYERRELSEINHKWTDRKDPDDYQKALEFACKAAEKGNAKAQLYLGYMYYKGYGVAQDNAQSLFWFRKSAKQGNADAKTALKDRFNWAFKMFGWHTN